MQRDVPGIDHSFLAMDTEEGVEVVWNEVQFSERKSFKSQEVPFVFTVFLLCILVLKSCGRSSVPTFYHFMPCTLGLSLILI